MVGGDGENGWSEVRRMCWLLYTDVNTRCNLLIDECAHLQQTVNSYLADGAGGNLPQDQKPEEREWLPEDQDVRDDQYYFRTPQERGLRNLFAAMGGLAHALEGNQRNLRAAYSRFVAAAAEQKQDDSLYWFVSLRGHLLNAVFPYYLEHLEHAHEKLIQLLENMPGALPGPTLLRRWSSGGYGEFLSDYSRHVNFAVQKLFWTFCVDEAQTSESSKQLSGWRRHQYFVHTWSHTATSLTTLNSVHTANGEIRDWTTVWSSYFYLEQPILFPLLYHECAHHYLSQQRADPSNKTAASRSALWFDRAEETAELLTRVASFVPSQANAHGFWRQFVEEIWADTVSIVLCGDGYLAALALQVIGLEGDYPAYSDFYTDSDTRIPLDHIGGEDRKVRNVQYPNLDLAYFWEARLGIAVQAYLSIHGPHGTEWAQLIRTLLSGWNSSGKEAMAERIVSKEHETFWLHRAELNSWVRDVVWDALEEFLRGLRKVRHWIYPIKRYRLGHKFLEVISQDLKKLGAEILLDTGGIQEVDFPPGRKWCLEDLAPKVRLELAGRIDEEFQKARSGSTENWLNKWAVTYSDYICCDGGVAFRLALEWVLMQKDIVATAAELLNASTERDCHELLGRLPKHERGLVEKIRVAVWADFHQNNAGKNAPEVASNLVRNIYWKYSRDWPHLNTVLEEVKTLLLDRFSTFAAKHDAVGIYSLGVVRPAQIVKSKGYGAGFKAVDEYYARCDAIRGNYLRRVGLKAGQGHVLMPLFGEYNFAVYQPGFTQAEKDVHPEGVPQCILKPRAVLRMANRDLPVGCEYVRVSQVAFKYRWQWLLLCKELEHKADFYLSSGWEDVLLVTYHTSHADCDTAIREYGLGAGHWRDTHSSIGLPTLPTSTAQSPAGQQVRPPLFGEAPTPDICEKAYRTGRYDMVLAWAAKTPQELWRALDSIPFEDWRHVESMVTSICRGGGKIYANPNQITSHVILKHHQM